MVVVMVGGWLNPDMMYIERERNIWKISCPKKMFLSGFISLFFHRGVHMFLFILLCRVGDGWDGMARGKEKRTFLTRFLKTRKKGLYVWPRALKWAESDLWWEVGRGESWMKVGHVRSAVCVCERHTKHTPCVCVGVFVRWRRLPCPLKKERTNRKTHTQLLSRSPTIICYSL